MMVGVSIIDLMIDGCQSLKEKRHVLKSLKARIRNNFNVSVTELDDHDLWQRCKLGITVGAKDRAGIDEVLSDVANFVNRDRSVSIIDIQTELR